MTKKTITLGIRGIVLGAAMFAGISGASAQGLYGKAGVGVLDAFREMAAASAAIAAREAARIGVCCEARRSGNNTAHHCYERALNADKRHAAGFRERQEHARSIHLGADHCDEQPAGADRG